MYIYNPRNPRTIASWLVCIVLLCLYTLVLYYASTLWQYLMLIFLCRRCINSQGPTRDGAVQYLVPIQGEPLSSHFGTVWPLVVLILFAFSREDGALSYGSPSRSYKSNYQTIKLSNLLGNEGRKKGSKTTVRLGRETCLWNIVDPQPQPRPT